MGREQITVLYLEKKHLPVETTEFYLTEKPHSHPIINTWSVYALGIRMWNAVRWARLHLEVDLSQVEVALQHSGVTVIRLHDISPGRVRWWVLGTVLSRVIDDDIRRHICLVTLNIV